MTSLKNGHSVLRKPVSQIRDRPRSEGSKVRIETVIGRLNPFGVFEGPGVEGEEVLPRF